MSRYFGDILLKYRVSKDIDTIFSWRNIGPAIFRDKYREIGDISRYIGDFGDKSAIFPDISHGQRGSTEVKRATVKSMCYSAPFFFCFRRDLNPKPKGLGSIHLPSGLTCPCYIICTKLIYT